MRFASTIGLLTASMTLGAAGGAGGGGSGADGEAVKLTLLSKGAGERAAYYMPIRTEMSETKPESIKKLPEGLAAPMFGAFKIGGRDGATYHVVLDEPDGKPAKLLVDTNGDGDLTNDPEPEWTAKPGGKTEDDKPLTMYAGSAKLNLGTAEKPYEVGVSMYRFDKNDPKRAALKSTILYYRDYGTEGEIKLGDNSYKVLLLDDAATGDFRGKEVGEDPKVNSGVKLLIDRDGNGSFRERGEQYDARRPFNIGGTTYELADIAKDGLAFAVKKSEKTVDEIKPAPQHGVGKSITAFEAKLMDGKDVKFPGDYKGKIVMVDFWATWCGPCMKEVPNLVEVYKKHHGKGFEILGVTLDQKNAEEKIKQVTGDKGMTWSQVYDGGGWEARVPQMYAIESIPAAYLVDGDTGKILATTAELRGENLEKTIEKALAGKQGN